MELSSARALLLLLVSIKKEIKLRMELDKEAGLREKKMGRNLGKEN